MKEEPRSFVAYSNHLPGLLPIWGSPHLCSLLPCAYLNGCTVKCVRELMWLKTDSDKENYRRGGAEGSWGTAQSHPTRKSHLGQMQSSGCLDTALCEGWTCYHKDVLRSLLTQLLGLLFFPVCVTQSMTNGWWLLYLSLPWAICSCILSSSAKAFCSEWVSLETSLTHELLIFSGVDFPSLLYRVFWKDGPNWKLFYLWKWFHFFETPCILEETSASSGCSGGSEGVWQWKGTGIARDPRRRLTFNTWHFSLSPVVTLLSSLVLFILLAIPKRRLPLTFGLWIRSPQDLRINVI